MTQVSGIASTPTIATSPSAVAWISGRHAAVATIGHDGRVRTCEIDRGWWTQGRFVNRVARTIGACNRVEIIGPRSARLALERAFVVEFRRPDDLIDVETSGVVDLDELVARVRKLGS
jgi:hypothetical protein